MERSTQAPRPEPTEAEREFWRRAVEAARREAAAREVPPAGGEDC